MMIQLVRPSISMGDPVNAKRYGTSERPWRSEKDGGLGVGYQLTFDSRSLSYVFSFPRDGIKKQNHQNHHHTTRTAFACSKVHQKFPKRFLCGARHWSLSALSLSLSSAPSFLSIIIQLASLNDIFVCGTILRYFRLIPPYVQF